eukprot:1162142-Pelagomonas_calceolata.AAC.7
MWLTRQPWYEGGPLLCLQIEVLSSARAHRAGPWWSPWRLQIEAVPLISCAQGSSWNVTALDQRCSETKTIRECFHVWLMTQPRMRAGSLHCLQINGTCSRMVCFTVVERQNGGLHGGNIETGIESLAP